MTRIRRRYALPAGLADLVPTLRRGRAVPTVIRHRTDGDRVTAVEESPDRWTLVVALGPGETRQAVDVATADALAPTLPSAWGCEAYDAVVEDAAGEPRNATFLVSALRGFVDVAFDNASEAEAFAPPAWMAGLAELSGAQSYPRMGGPSPSDGAPSSVAELAALLEPGRQRKLSWGMLMRGGDGFPQEPAWAIVRREARDLGMSLSADKALVRSALAPLVAGMDALAFLGTLDPHDARLLVEDGLFSLRMADDGAFLGSVPWTAGTRFEEGVSILGPEAAVPAALPGGIALDLAREGYHVADDGRRFGLWSLDRLDRVRVRLCGIDPESLSTHFARDPFE